VLLWVPAGPDDGLAGLLRPGDAGSNTAKDHEQVSIGPLEELRRKVLYEEIPVPWNAGRGGHEFKEAFPDPKIHFPVTCRANSPGSRGKWAPEGLPRASVAPPVAIYVYGSTPSAPLPRASPERADSAR
jgi:hypothetical protein